MSTRRVRIKGLPNKQAGGAMSKSTSSPADGLRRFLEGKKNYDQGMNQFAAPEFEVNSTLKPVDPSQANVEAEKGEIAVVPGMAGIPESYTVAGKRHPNGGTPLNLAPDSFIFSDHKKGMKIKDKAILAEFGMSVPKKGRVKGYTPAEIAKKYDLNKYKKILLDPDSDRLERETAEDMIKNYNIKLGKLALVQESMKGFPQGVPAIAQPYLQSMEMDPQEFLPQPPQQGLPMGQPPVAAYGTGVSGDPSMYSYGYGGVNKSQSKRFPGLDIAAYGGETFSPGSTEFTGAFWDSILQDGGQPGFQIAAPVDVDTFRANLAGNLGEKAYHTGFVSDLNTAPQFKGAPITEQETTRLLNQQRQAELARAQGAETFGNYSKRDVEVLRALKARQQMRAQDGGEAALLDYLETQGAVGDTLTYGKKPVVATESKYYPYSYTPQVRGKDLDKVILDNRAYQADSVVTNPAFPQNTGVAWISGKPVVVPTAKKAMEAAAFHKKYGAYKAKGKSTQTVYPRYKKQPVAAMTEGGDVIDYQDGGFLGRLFGRGRQNQNQFTMAQQPRVVQGSDGQWYSISPDGTFTPLNQQTVPTSDPKVEAAPERGLTWQFDPETGQPVSGPQAATTTTVEADPNATVEETNIETTEGPATVKIPEKYKTDEYREGSGSWSRDNLKVGDYYQDAGGNWHHITYVPEVVTYEGEDLASVFGNRIDPETGENISQNVANSYAFLERTFQDPEVRELFGDKTRAALRNKEYYKRKDGSTAEMYSEEEITKMSDDYLVEQHLNMQKRNYALKAQGFDALHFADRNGDLRKDLPEAVKAMYSDLGISNINDAFEEVGVPITDEMVKAGDIGVQQATYFGYNDLVGDKENLPPEMQEKLQYFSVFKEGAEDEPLDRISPIDSKANNYYTDTTAGELDLINQGDIMSDPIIEEVAPDPITKGDPTFFEHVPRDEWWAQDIGNIAQLFGQRMGLKKYLPHSFPVDLARPDVVYFDPSRALAANAEQANIAAQAASAFAGPQATYRQTGIAGQSFANAANILADYENKNVGVANQYLDRVQQTANQEALANAERAQRLYDQTTIANQQFDNAKRAMNRNLFEGWRQGLTNKKMTQALNALYPQFETIPSIGGGRYRTHLPRPFVNTGASPYGGGSGSNQYLADFSQLKKQYPRVSDAAIKGQLDQKYGAPSAPVVDPRMYNPIAPYGAPNQGAQWFQQMQGMNPGVVPGGYTI